MKILPISTHTVYSNKNCKKPTFQAKIDEPLLNSLKQTAESLDIYTILENKLDQVSKWGNKNSTICVSTDIETTENTFGELHLALSNEKISALYAGNLNVPKAKTLFEQLLLLREDDILKAEKEITETSRIAKLEAIKKIVQNPEYMEEITGKTNPSDKELIKGINKLSEEDLMKYRFELFGKTSESFDPELDVQFSK